MAVSRTAIEEEEEGGRRFVDFCCSLRARGFVFAVGAVVLVEVEAVAVAVMVRGEEEGSGRAEEEGGSWLDGRIGLVMISMSLELSIALRIPYSDFPPPTREGKS